MDSEAFVMLANGRRTAASLADRLQISGDRELGQRVVDGFNMMI
jgi:hypothetical protein